LFATTFSSSSSSMILNSPKDTVPGRNMRKASSALFNWFPSFPCKAQLIQG